MSDAGENAAKNSMNIEDLVGETLASLEQAADAMKSAPSAASASAVSSEANLSKAVAELKDAKPAGPDGVPIDSLKKKNENKLLDEMKNAFTDESYREMIGKMMASETEGQSAPSKETPGGDPASLSAGEGNFVKNIGACMRQLKEEEENAVGGDFFDNFMKAFEGAMDNDDNFSKSMEFLMSGMLSTNVLCDSLRQIAEQLEPFLHTNKCTPQDRERYEQQLRLYKEILVVYEDAPTDVSPEQMEIVNKKLQELQNYGLPPQEIMDKLKGSEDKPEEGDDSFEDFVKNMGLGQGLGEQEQEMIKQLSSNPKELEQIMSEMAKEIKSTDEPCKQQ
eukprot:GEMP01065547.1.p1 GENE.GEMP01065547.1~~GEMP01065547.1.p1  ORF type:complete len:335 (+),score=88.18 GEMP01065547.1:135-1139(+)